MVLNGYSLLDVKTGLYSPPFFLAHDVLALRAVLELCSDRNTTPGKYPADYVLYRLGSFDDNTGMVSAGVPVNMGTLAGLLAGVDKAAAF